MAGFVFQLEGVLRHRKHLERQKQRALAEARAQMAGLETELRNLNRMINDATERLRAGGLTGVLDMGLLTAHRRFVNSTQRQSVLIAQRMVLVQRQIDEAQIRLIEAAKERKMIERLKEKQQARWLTERDRKELNELDEIGMQLSNEQLSHEPRN